MGEESQSTLDTHTIEMSDINDENLPSIEDYSDVSDDLPSLSDFLVEEELPSFQEFVSPEEVEEDTQTIEDAEGNAFIEVTDVVKAPEWSELVRLVNNVRESIPDIPEINAAFVSKTLFPREFIVP